MSPIVPSSSQQALAAVPYRAVPGAPSGPSLKWLWAAIGVLGISVVALGTTLVLQNTARSSSASSSPAVTTTSAADPATPAGVEEKSNKPQAGSDNIAIKNESRPAPPGQAAAQSLQPVQQAYATQPAATPLSQRTVAQAPVCVTCGRVESVQTVQQAAPATGVGAVAGGVLGAVVGNQVGKGSGRAAATVLGAVGGGYVGHKVEERTRTQTVYQIAVRMENGSMRRFTRSQPVAVGTPVMLQGKGFRVDDGAAARGEEPYPRAQPGAVRVADTY